MDNVTWPMESDPTFVEKTRRFELLVALTVTVTFSLIVIIGLVGNLLVIAVVLMRKHMRNTTNILIINLAVADLMFIIFCVPFTAISYSLPSWPFGTVVCKLYQYSLNVSAYASVYTLVLMSMDRYLAVVHPISSIGYRTERNAYIVTCVLWTTIMLLNIPVINDHEHVSYNFLDEVRSTCLNYRIFKDKNYGVLFYGCFFVFGYLLPLLTVCVLYGFMLKRLLFSSVPGKSRTAENMRAKRRVTYMVIVVVAVFAMCWLPVHVMFLVQFFGKPNEQTMTFIVARIFSTCLAYTNSCVNPVLYAFLSENFRKSFRRLIVCRLRADQHEQPLRLHETRSASACRTAAITTSTTNATNTAVNNAMAACHAGVAGVQGVGNGAAAKSAVGVARIAGVAGNRGADASCAALLKPAQETSAINEHRHGDDTVDDTSSKTYICTDC